MVILDFHTHHLDAQDALISVDPRQFDPRRAWVFGGLSSVARSGRSPMPILTCWSSVPVIPRCSPSARRDWTPCVAVTWHFRKRCSCVIFSWHMTWESPSWCIAWGRLDRCLMPVGVLAWPMCNLPSTVCAAMPMWHAHGSMRVATSPSALVSTLPPCRSPRSTACSSRPMTLPFPSATSPPRLLNPSTSLPTTSSATANARHLLTHLPITKQEAPCPRQDALCSLARSLI